MRDRSYRSADCDIEDFLISETDDDVMAAEELEDLFDLTKSFEDGEVDVQGVAERLTTILGRCSSGTMSGDESDLSFDEDDDAEDFENQEDEEHDEAEDSSVGKQWENELDIHDRNLILAGYNNCMDEAIRFLVEEEQYSSEHPVVQGLKQHLLSQQERLEIERLIESARAVNEQCQYAVLVNPTSVFSSTSTELGSNIISLPSVASLYSDFSCNNR